MKNKVDESEGTQQHHEEEIKKLLCEVDTQTIKARAAAREHECAQEENARLKKDLEREKGLVDRVVNALERLASAVEAAVKANGGKMPAWLLTGLAIGLVGIVPWILNRISSMA